MALALDIDDLPAIPSFPFPEGAAKDVLFPSCSCASDVDDAVLTRCVRVGESTFECDVCRCIVNMTCPLAIRLRKSVVDFQTYWTVDHEGSEPIGSSAVSAAAWARGCVVLAAVNGEDCMHAHDAADILANASLPAQVELLELRPQMIMILDGWPFRFGHLVVEQRKLSNLDLAAATKRVAVAKEDADQTCCVVVRVDGAARRAGAVQGSVILAVNGAVNPTAQEIQDRAERLAPESGKVEVLLERPMPLPTRPAQLNLYALTTRQSAFGPSGRMAGKHVVAYDGP